MGDSLGGGIVGGYAGRYTDVAAVVSDGWSNAGFSPEASATAAAALGPQLAEGSDYSRLAPDEATCRRMTLYEPGVAALLRESYCRSGSGPVPVGDSVGIPHLVSENVAAIPAVGRGTPVLLAFGDHDVVFPPDKALAEYAYWKGACGCDVELWTAKNAGHALAAHRSMTAYTTKVVKWLAAKGLGPRAK